MKLNDAFKGIVKTTGAKALVDSKPTGYLDTGSLAINRVLTGDIHITLRGIVIVSFL